MILAFINNKLLSKKDAIKHIFKIYHLYVVSALIHLNISCEMKTINYKNIIYYAINLD